MAEHHESLRRVARLYVRDVAVADEVVQEAWLGVIRGLWAFEGRSSLKTWIFRILVNRARTRAAREGLGARFVGSLAAEESDASEPDAEASSVAAPDASPERSLLASELGEKLQTAIDALPPNLRTVLWLHDVEGWSSEDVCNALQIQETNRRVLLHRARSRVRAALGPYLEEDRGGTRG